VETIHREGYDPKLGGQCGTLNVDLESFLGAKSCFYSGEDGDEQRLSIELLLLLYRVYMLRVFSPLGQNVDKDVGVLILPRFLKIKFDESGMKNEGNRLWSKEACRKSDIDLKAMLFSTFYQRIVDEGFSEVKEIADALTVFKVIGGARRELDSHALCLDTTGITAKEVKAKIRKRMNTDSVPEATIESEEEYVDDENTPGSARTIGSGLREVEITTVEEPGDDNKADGRTKRKRSATPDARSNPEPCHLSFKEVGVKLGKVFSEVTGTETGRRHIQELMKLGVIQKITFRKDYHEIFASLADEDLEISEGLQTKVEAIEGKLAE